jgi:hypothetical protein
MMKNVKVGKSKKIAQGTSFDVMQQETKPFEWKHLPDPKVCKQDKMPSFL